MASRGVCNLMVAVLQDAVSCARGLSGSLADQADARAWFQSSEQEWLFSFANICEVMGLDAQAVRGTLRRRQLEPHRHLHGQDARRFSLARVA